MSGLLERLRCLVGLHAWIWHALPDENFAKGPLRMSRCICCGRVEGGWRGRAPVPHD